MRRLSVCSSCVLVVGVMLSVSAKTVAWYRFDEGVPGEVTTAETRLANSADDSSVPAATPHSQNGTTWGTDENYMPRFVAPVGAGVLQVRDPVTGTVYPNRAALKFMGEVATTVNPASALDVPNDNLKLASFTAECFFRAPSNIGTQTMSTLLHMQRQTGAATWTLQIYGGGLFVRSTIKTGGSTPVKCDYVKYEIDKIKDGKWHHAAITYDAATCDMSLWLDYAKLKTWNYGANDGFDYRADGKFLIGANTVQRGRNFPGEMDEVRISDMALDADGFLRQEASPFTGDPDTIVYMSFSADRSGIASMNEVRDAPYPVSLVKNGTVTDDTLKFGDASTLPTTNISEGVLGRQPREYGRVPLQDERPVEGTVPRRERSAWADLHEQLHGRMLLQVRWPAGRVRQRHRYGTVPCADGLLGLSGDFRRASVVSGALRASFVHERGGELYPERTLRVAGEDRLASFCGRL